MALEDLRVGTRALDRIASAVSAVKRCVHS